MPELTNYVSRKQKTALPSVMSNGMLAVLLLTALTVEWKLRVLWKVSCVGQCFAGAGT